MDHPIVAGGDLAGQRVAGYFRRSVDGAHIWSKQAPSALRLMNGCNTELAETAHDGVIGSHYIPHHLRHDAPPAASHLRRPHPKELQSVAITISRYYVVFQFQKECQYQIV
ncbi:hypothetical protein EKH55_5691 (plasmid) [Sinorhizobium alkalisoli]|nr:hypothetical protein EKH55_5691 [Sinorhizobium alkalisoli]